MLIVFGQTESSNNGGEVTRTELESNLFFNVGVTRPGLIKIYGYVLIYYLIRLVECMVGWLLWL